MATTNIPSKLNNTNSTSTSSKPPKIILKRVLEINDSLKLHLYGTQLILEAGLMLNIPQITISKGQIIYHKFYYNHNRNLIDYPPFHIAMTCTYLASKLDENTRRHRDVLTVFDRLYKKRTNQSIQNEHIRTIDPHGKRYSIWKENLFNFEIRILASMGFNCNILSIHKYLLQLLIDLLSNECLAKDAWALLNDLHRIPNILNYNPLQIACSCIFLSARRLKIKLPNDPKWSDIFGVNKLILHQIASLILELLQLPKYAFKLPNNNNNNNNSLDYNPKPVKEQQKIIKKRHEEKHKRLKKVIKLKTIGIKNENKLKITKLVTVPKPILGMKQINLSNSGVGTLTPPINNNKNNNNKSTNIHFSSNKNKFESINNNNKKVENMAKNDKKDKEKSRKSYKRDRDRRHKRRKHYSSRRSGRRRRSSSRRDDGSSSESDYHSRHRRRRDRDRDRKKDRRDRSISYSRSMERKNSKSKSKSRSRSRSRSQKTDKSENKRSRSRSKSKQKQIDNKKKDDKNNNENGGKNV